MEHLYLLLEGVRDLRSDQAEEGLSRDYRPVPLQPILVLLMRMQLDIPFARRMR